ncbi:tRNA lysidine(34) synthetase TilS [Loigolactobacillus zhaoyuanensis]|uniref:tRNA lysidine(34) synthetase TilS n=1 Tax=Loigolactobacillus zhaoyuanensis TaxID=2486017 RepID=UPI000F749529|nr:tRNA lysidine(34) synthetase TilS [Loigolactobacillus zhaoyuanensis]
MRTEFTAQIKKLQLWTAETAVLVAVSTGADSMALLDLLAHLPANLRPKINVVHVNHQLRAASTNEAIFLTDYCAAHGWPLYQTKWPLTAHPAHGTEAAARQFRYDYFAQVLRQQQIPLLLTAHHADDQLETLLMRLARGGDVQQLAAIATERSFHQAKLVRPLLPFTRQQLRAYVTQRQLTYFDDVTNQDTQFTRNQIRQQIVPVLKQIQPLAAEHAANYAAQLQRLLRVNQQQMDQVLIENGQFMATGYRGELGKWQSLSSDLQHLALDQLMTRLMVTQGIEVSQAQKGEIRQLLQGPRAQAGLDLAAGWQLTKSYHYFTIAPAPAPIVAATVDLMPGATCQVEQWQITLQPASVTGGTGVDSLEVWLAANELPLQIRHRQPGDRLPLRHGHQKIKRILSDKKIPQQQRERLWLITTQQNTVLWLLGVKKSQLFNPQQTDKIHYRITIKK